MRTSTRLGLVALLALAGCRPPEAVEPEGGVGVASPPATESRSFRLTNEDIDAVVRGVSAARQLPVSHPVGVTRLSQAKFVERLLGRRDADKGAQDLTEESAFLVGFDFVPAPGQRKGLASVDEVLSDQVVGFYDTEADRVFLPDVALHKEGDLFEQRAVLAHEVQHAIQAQRFPRPKKARSSDESLAQLSVIEGDAMAAMGAHIGAEQGAPVGRTLRRLVEVTKKVPLADVTRGEEKRPLDRALDLTRTRLEFPYREGMLFVADVYRAGGFPLVDKLYERFPTSTEQILHPEKYLAGEEPRPVGDPIPPKGYRRATADTLGELDTRTLLAKCVDRATAEKAAAGWAGDRFAVLAGADRHLAVAWISAWDTEQDARELEAALGQNPACFKSNAVGLEKNDYAIGAGVTVRREGKLVAFLRGFRKDEEDSMAKGLFPLVGPEPARRPVSSLVIPPRVKLPEPERGSLRGDVYQNDWLGVVGRTPEGMLGHLEEKGFEFSIERPGVLARGGLLVSTRITSDESNEIVFKEAEDALAQGLGEHNLRIQALGGQAVRTSLGSGVERTFRVLGTRSEIRFVLLPICAGTGSIMFMQAYGDPYARQVLDGWVESFRWINGRNLRACDFLDPK